MQRLADTQDELEAQQARNTELQSQIDGSSSSRPCRPSSPAKQVLLSTIFVNEVSWSSALLDVSRVIPDASYLTNLTGQITADPGAARSPSPRRAERRRPP